MQADSVFCIGIQHATEEAANAKKDYFSLQLEARVSSVPLHDELIILREMNTMQHCLVKTFMALSSKNNKQKFGMISVVHNIIISHLAQTSRYPLDKCISNDIHTWEDTDHMLIGNYYIVQSDTYLYWPLPFSCKNSNYLSNTEICLVWYLSMRIQYISWNNPVIILNKFGVLGDHLDYINQPRQSAQVLRHHRDHPSTKILKLTSLAFRWDKPNPIIQATPQWYFLKISNKVFLGKQTNKQRKKKHNKNPPKYNKAK